MSDYPSSSPWGPHGPQVSPFSVTPNPTAPSAAPDYGTQQVFSAPAASSYGSAGSAPAAGGYVGNSAFARISIGAWMRNFAIGGLVLGALAGLARAVLLHAPPAVIGMVAFRMGVAGAAAGAGIPPALRALATAFRAFIWIALATALWLIAMSAAGQLGWLSRLR